MSADFATLLAQAACLRPLLLNPPKWAKLRPGVSFTLDKSRVAASRSLKDECVSLHAWESGNIHICTD